MDKDMPHPDVEIVPWTMGELKGMIEMTVLEWSWARRSEWIEDKLIITINSGQKLELLFELKER